jgi:DNA polymerase III epsilon subunit-like protein
MAFTALSLVATGPSPGRARVVRVVAHHIQANEVVERFDALINPERRVPKYALERIGVESDMLDSQPTFAAIVDELERFVGERPVLAQDVQLTWAFLEAEARRSGRILLRPTLLDLNDLALQVLNLKGKPSLGVVASQLGIGSVHLGQIDEEARVLGQVGGRLLGMGTPEAAAAPGTALRSGATARGLPEEPGVYVLRDRDQAPLYVGKARHLRSRMAAYVHRPLGPTRRLEGLVGAVHGVDTTQCQTDLEALILEDREIRRLQPRFNTVRQQRTPRYWIRVPPRRVSPRGRVLAPPRLELSSGPGAAEGEFIGPFRNEALAEQARALAREVFELEALRRSDSVTYTDRLTQALAFLRGTSDAAERLARRSTQLLRRVAAFDVSSLVLPADPRGVRYAVVRPAASGIEGFILDRAILVGSTVSERGEDGLIFARKLLARHESRTSTDDVGMVLRWFGAQRAPARLIWLPEDALAAAHAIENAFLDLAAAWET